MTLIILSNSSCAEARAFFEIKIQRSSEEKKMAAVHFTTIPCEPNTAYKAQLRESYFYSICPCTEDIV